MDDWAARTCVPNGSPISAQSRSCFDHTLIVVHVLGEDKRVKPCLDTWLVTEAKCITWQIVSLSYPSDCIRYNFQCMYLLSFRIGKISSIISGVWRFEMQKLNHYAEKWWIVRGFGRLTVCLMRFVNNNEWLYSNCSSSRWRRSWFDCSFVFICR